MASTVAGKEYGVAKGATVVAVQVLDCRGQGEAADIIGGIEWAVADAAARGTTQAVIQMSITNTYSETQKDVVKAAHDAGVVIVLAAGNREADTCGWSYLLGGIHIVINVGSSTSADTVSGFSSFGDCVDLFAPGSNIDAAWVDSDSAVTSLSGTSMAAPHVSGAVAQLRAQRPELDADGVTEVLLCMATEGALTGVPRRTPNLFLYAGSAMDNDAHTNCHFPPKAPPPPAPPPAPPYAPYQKPCKCEVPWPCYSPGSDSCSGSGNMDDYPDDAAIIATDSTTTDAASAQLAVHKRVPAFCVSEIFCSFLFHCLDWRIRHSCPGVAKSPPVVVPGCRGGGGRRLRAVRRRQQRPDRPLRQVLHPRQPLWRALVFLLLLFLLLFLWRVKNDRVPHPVHEFLLARLAPAVAAGRERLLALHHELLDLLRVGPRHPHVHAVQHAVHLLGL